MKLSNDDLAKEIGRRFKKLRKDHKLTIAQVARSSKMSRNTIAGIEKGTTDWLLTSMYRLCRFYRVSPIDLLEGL